MQKREGIGSRGMKTVVGKVLILVLASCALVMMQACGGSSNFNSATTGNPAPGVTLQKIQITPANSVILLSETRQLYATGIYSDGSSEDISSQVTWAASSQPNPTNYVTVSSQGVATASSVGATVISATVGNVTGLLQLLVGTDGFSSSNMAILPVLSKTAIIDVAYMAQQTQIQGAYAVQEVNLDADKFSSTLPPPVALLASIPMPSGFEPNLTVASQTSGLVAVISYTSPSVQIIDASNNPDDALSNTIIATFKAPVTQSVTLNGISCMICAAVVNPLNNQLILSTAQGYYSMNFATGAFTAMPFTPAPQPSANFTIDPVATPDPYILSTAPNSGEVQILDLTTNAVTTYPNIGVLPSAGVVDLITQFSAVVDGNTSDQTLMDLTNPQSPSITTVQSVAACSAGPAYLNMAALGVSASTSPSTSVHNLFTGQTNGSCVGVAAWPGLGVALTPSNIFYAYGTLPPTPDGNSFVAGNDPSAIATFNSVNDQKDYGILIDGNQQWIAKVSFNNLASFVTFSFGGPTLPTGQDMTTYLAEPDQGGEPIIFLPTPSTSFTVSLSSIGFGSLTVGTSSPQLSVNVSNIGSNNLLPQFTLGGTNPGDFAYISNCAVTLLPASTCNVDITFTPTATGPRSATLSVASQGLPTQIISLSGTGS